MHLFKAGLVSQMYHCHISLKQQYRLAAETCLPLLSCLSSKSPILVEAHSMKADLSLLVSLSHFLNSCLSLFEPRSQGCLGTSVGNAQARLSLLVYSCGERSSVTTLFVYTSFYRDRHFFRQAVIFLFSGVERLKSRFCRSMINITVHAFKAIASRVEPSA